MSSTPTPLPSRWAAMPRMPPIVTTPVPPTPVTMMSYVCLIAGNSGSGIDALSAVAVSGTPCLSFAPSTVTKDGQNPFRHEKSLLQLDWSMVPVRPHLVSGGCTDPQFDFTPQSPQPSQTSSLMIPPPVRIGVAAPFPAPAF